MTIKTKIKLFDTVKALDAEIADIIKTGQGWQRRLHIALCSAAVLCAKNENDAQINKLFQGTTTMVHSNTVALWLAQFAPVTWDSKTELFKCSGKKIKAFKENEAEAIKAIVESPEYHTLVKPPKPFQGGDLVKDAAKMLAKYDTWAAGLHTGNEGEELSEEEKARIKNNTHENRRLLAKLAGEERPLTH